jgi:hypothetical protein
MEPTNESQDAEQQARARLITEMGLMYASETAVQAVLLGRQGCIDAISAALPAMSDRSIFGMWVCLQIVSGAKIYG